MIGKSLTKASITQKFQLSVEAQFARMFFAVVALFYVSWTTLMVSKMNIVVGSEFHS